MTGEGDNSEINFVQFAGHGKENSDRIKIHLRRLEGDLLNMRCLYLDGMCILYVNP